MNGELEELGERIAEQAAHLDAAKHRLLTDLREFDACGGWHVQGAATCAHWLAWRVGWDLVTARDHLRVARKLADFALIDDALRRGELSYSKVRAVLRIATPANEALLLDHARLMTASQLEKTCRKYALVQQHGKDDDPQVDEQRRYVRRRDLEDGMVKIEAVLHPEEAELVWRMLDHAASRLAREAASAAGETTRQDSAESRHVPPAARVDAESGRAEVAGSTNAGAPEAVAAGSRAGAEARQAGSAGGTGVERCEVKSAGCTAAGAGRAEVAGGMDAGAPEAVAPGSREGVEARSGESIASVDAGQAATCLEHLGGRDSAESPAAAELCRTATGASAAASTGKQTSAAGPSRAGELAGELTDELTGEPAEWTGRPSSEPAGCAESSGRSLLDRLLEEADALRGSDAGSGDGAEAARWDASTWSEAAAAQGPKQMARRDASVLSDRAAAARKAFNRADALVELAQGYLRGDRPDRSPIEVTLTVPVSVLRDEVGDPVGVGELGEAFVSREAARRLSCDAGVVEVIEDEQGTPLSVGRKRRTIAGALRRALQRRDHACTYPGCTNRLFLEGHHIQHWADGGETSLSNTALLCSLHHRHVHELGFTIELGPDQRPRFRDPQGRLVAPVPDPPALAGLGWPRIRTANEPLAIDADTIAGPWDGTLVDYARIVGHLATADGLA